MLIVQMYSFVCVPEGILLPRVFGFAGFCFFFLVPIWPISENELQSPAGLCFSRHSFAEHKRTMLLYPAAAPAVCLPVPG